MLALATNVGVGGMVEGFRQTFTHWLDGRLVEEVYFEAAVALYEILRRLFNFSNELRLHETCDSV